MIMEFSDFIDSASVPVFAVAVPSSHQYGVLREYYTMYLCPSGLEPRPTG